MKNLLFILTLLTFSNLAIADNLGRGDTTTVELITFETESVYLQQATSTTDIWQIGQPSKSIFNEAYSGLNAIMTDTLNSYPTNNHSWFDLLIPQYYGYLGISFYHKYNTDTTSDGGYITISYDNGVTWENIIYDTSYHSQYANQNPLWDYTPAGGYNKNLYSKENTLFNGEYGFSGTLNEWQLVELSWGYYTVKKSRNISDTCTIRFNFISDKTESNKEGWLIDNLKIFQVDLGGNIHETPVSNLEVFPNPITENSLIKTKDQSIIESTELYNLSGQLIIKDDVHDTQYSFIRNGIEPGIYFLKSNFKKGSETVKLIVK